MNQKEESIKSIIDKAISDLNEIQSLEEQLIKAKKETNTRIRKDMRKVRIMLEMSQDEAAHIMGISTTHIRLMEYGQREYKIKFVKIINDII